MIDIRSAWFDGNFGPPPGNKSEWRRQGQQQRCMVLPAWHAGSLYAASPPASQRFSPTSQPLPPVPRPPSPAPPAAVPTERSAWQQPQEAFTISERGRGAAAVELAKDMQLRMKQQGCKEEFVPNADLLADGLVDFLPAAALTPEELERQRLVAEATAKATR